MHKRVGFIFLYATLPFIGYAQDNASDFNFSGYVDTSYNYLLRDNKFTSGTFDRVYDINPNGFTLQQASMTLAYQPKEGLGGLVNPVIGRDTYIFSPYGWNPDYGSQWFGFDIPQAYIQYAIGSFTVIGGELLTLASAESLMPTKDTNFSRSILWGYATPTTTLGFRGTYVINEKVTLIAGLDDGWDTIRDFNRRKTVELSIVYTPHPIVAIALTGYTGGQRAEDRTSSGPESARTLIDLVTTVNATDKLTFILNYDYGIQSKALLPNDNIAEAVWQGIAGYSNYKFDDNWRISFRGEIFSDRNGYRTGVEQSWKELTLTLGYSPIKNIEFRGETRHDFSNVDSFVNADGIGVNNNQQSFALEGVFQF
ncbi:MAG: outer membrane beta-barrel protein [Gammaproteobacteria bacterium]